MWYTSPPCPQDVPSLRGQTRGPDRQQHCCLTCRFPPLFYFYFTSPSTVNHNFVPAKCQVTLETFSLELLLHSFLSPIQLPLHSLYLPYKLSASFTLLIVQVFMLPYFLTKNSFRSSRVSCRIYDAKFYTTGTLHPLCPSFTSCPMSILVSTSQTALDRVQITVCPFTENVRMARTPQDTCLILMREKHLPRS